MDEKQNHRDVLEKVLAVCIILATCTSIYILGMKKSGNTQGGVQEAWL
jgi:hypothetical protein